MAAPVATLLSASTLSGKPASAAVTTAAVGTAQTGTGSIIIGLALTPNAFVNPGTSFTLTDSLGNTYVLAQVSPGTASMWGLIFYCQSPTTLTAATTFTLTISGGSKITSYAMRVWKTDVKVVPTSDAASNAGSTTGVTVAPVAGSVPSADYLWVGVHGFNNPSLTDTISSTGWTLTPAGTATDTTTGGSAGSNTCGKFGTKGVTASTVAETFNGTASSGVNWRASIVPFIVYVPATPVSNTSGFAIESGQGVAGTDAAVADAAGAVSQTGSDPLEAASALSQTVAETVESNLGVAATEQHVADATGGIAATDVPPLDSVQGVASSESSVVESNQALSAAELAVVDVASGVAASEISTVEATGAVAATEQDPVESGQGISSSAVAVVEQAQGVAGLVAAALEAVGAVSAAGATVAEAIQAVVEAVLGSVEALAGVSTVETSPVETASTGALPVSTTAGLVIESLGPVSTTAGEQVEAGQIVATLSTVPLEDAAGISSVSVLPLDGERLAFAIIASAESAPLAILAVLSVALRIVSSDAERPSTGSDVDVSVEIASSAARRTEISSSITSAT